MASGGTSFHWPGEALRFTQRIEQETWLETVKTPILLFQAEDDTYVDNKGQDRFCLKVKDCRRILVPETRHETYCESDPARGPYLLTLLQIFEEQAWPKSGQDASQIRTESAPNEP